MTDAVQHYSEEIQSSFAQTFAEAFTAVFFPGKGGPVLFRKHKGMLEDSMATLMTVDSKAELMAMTRKELEPWGFDFKDESFLIEPYCSDPRIGWGDVHIVTIDGYGVVGFTNGPLA